MKQTNSARARGATGWHKAVRALPDARGRGGSTPVSRTPCGGARNYALMEVHVGVVGVGWVKQTGITFGGAALAELFRFVAPRESKLDQFATPHHPHRELDPPYDYDFT